MLRSMTGYGRGEASSGGVTVLVELRSVNNRFRDLQLRCPREYLPLESRVSQVLKDRFRRGRVDCFVRRSAAENAQIVEVDPALARQYVQALESLSEVIPGWDQTPKMELILAQSGVMKVTEAEVDVMREWGVVETALQAAAEDLLSMRETEGRALKRDLAGHLDGLRALVGEVEAAVDGIHERLYAKLDARIRRLLGDRIDANKLAQEVASLTDKADISEEIARLRSHCEQFSESLEDEEPVGRRLEFLLQELHREVNTIGSKAAEHPVARRVVDMKSILERMREQSANVE